MSKPGQHVVPSGGKWSVRKAGASRASGTFETQKEAISHAKGLAQNQGTVVFIHGSDGRICKRSDPYPPKG